MVIITIIAFILIFSLLILIHEWGHFAAARRAGIKVEEFGLGLPPRAKKLFKDKTGTIFSLNWIPFGGYVRLFGEDAHDPAILRDPKSFAAKSLGQRFLVIVAGVGMNFILGWLLVTIGFTVGMRPFLVTEEDLKAAIQQGIVQTTPVLYVHQVEPDSPAFKAGVKPGDAIQILNGEPAPPSEYFGDKVDKNGANSIVLLRDSKKLSLTLIPNAEGRFGFSISSQDLITDVGKQRYPFYEAPLKAAEEVGRLSYLTVKMLGRVVVDLVSRFTIPEGVAGPVGIARMTHTFIKQGFMAILQFMALISISLGVINVMPFPALDGGRLLFLFFELILGRRPNARWEGIIHTIGFGLLMLLIVAVTWNDILNLIRG